MDFVVIKSDTNDRKSAENPEITIFPEFIVGPIKDLMVRGHSFYAVWDDEKGMWSRNEQDVARMIDKEVIRKAESFPMDANVKTRLLRNFSSNKWNEFLKYCSSLPDNFSDLDDRVTFVDEEVKRTDYVSKRLPYALKSGDMEAFEEIISTTYDEIERKKIEWAIGAVLSGDSKFIQKFLVFYGASGTGKSTMLNIIEMLFEGYYSMFEAKALGKANSSFALEAFKTNPLVAIEHDGDLSKIEDNTKLNSIIGHDRMPVNEKFKSLYEAKFNAMLFIGTNKPVKITDAKSGIIRRLIDVQPTGNLIPAQRYPILMAQVKFELGAIAAHCLQVYSELGPNAYDTYVPTGMISATNHFYNFVEDHYLEFSGHDGVTLVEAWTMYKRYADDSNVKYPLSRDQCREELKNYFKDFYERRRLPDGTYKRNLYSGFKTDKFNYMSGTQLQEPVAPEITISLDRVSSRFDELFKDCKAQYDTGSSEYPLAKKWADVTTTLSMLDTKEVHYVIPPENHIVIDFDLKNEDGEKDLDRNLAAASKWPSTYTELSKSGKGVHLHYVYEGDASKLSTSYDEHVDILSFATGKSLRRKLTRCNSLPFATLSSGLPEKKGGKNVIDFEGLKNEKALRTLIKKNLNKEIHPSTKPSVDFIFKILDDAYQSGMVYDVSDMRNAIISFANGSTNQAINCLKIVNKMPFKSEEPESISEFDTDEIVFYDVEVYPNLFVVCWKRQGPGQEVVKMINPMPGEIEKLLKYKLVGFNNRQYDNHILYARLLGYSNEQLYVLSKKIISGSHNSKFLQAYNLSYTDIYCYSAAHEKMSLKKWQNKLKIHHVEMDIPWDEPVPEEKWLQVTDYCANDVISTEAVWDATQGSWTARQILAELTGLTPNDTTNKQSTKFIFGNDKNPQSQFVYTDLSEMFPGYKFDGGISTYHGEVVGEGGYVYAEPGMYENVPVLDAESMHPSSIEALNLFGDVYTARFSDLVTARKAIKHKEYDKVREMFEGKIAKYLETEELAKALSNALKTVINSVYGLTSAKFDNPFRDIRNVDNIVAKRGSLFMVDLKRAVQERGFQVAHIKTDSIKIPNASEEICTFVKEFGQKYGYTFVEEDDSPYEKFCLVNDAVYIAKTAEGTWSAVGTQFAVPYVFKTLFSKEEVTFDDLTEVKNVTSPAAIYLDLNEDLEPTEHDYHFVGKAGSFVPIKDGCGGGILLREKDGKYGAVTGTKGYRWMESAVVSNLGKEADVDMAYYQKLADDAVKAIEEFGDYKKFAA